MSNSAYSEALKNLLVILKKHMASNAVDSHSSLGSLGMTSLKAAQVVLELNATFKVNLRVHDIFLYPTPDALARHLVSQSTQPETGDDNRFSGRSASFDHEPVAIIAMDCRYPDANDCETFWNNCIRNKECISFFNRQEKPAGTTPDTFHNVYARGILDNIDHFDARFFNYSPRDARLSDPQHRLFIESASNVLEKAGYASTDKTHGKVGVYASMNDSTYMLDQYALSGTQDNLTDRLALQRLMSSQFLATRIAYLLDCQGPAITVQAACSSSLVAIVLACQQLASRECDMAIAGGVSIVTPQDRPYVYQQGNIYSPDGHCRPFDADASGTVFGNGLGVVLLKRLSQAIDDRDTIVSVIKGYALNNDGCHKVSYAAPSMQGQLDCILSAQAMAKVEAGSIQYVETHGTGTLVGDPIEIEALTRAFRQSTARHQFCAIGSVKANIGHTHVAAGAAGLIKAALALQHRKIPPALNFKTPNPAIDFRNSPFYVNTRLSHWRETTSPRRAAVSAFGVGGTNAHVILEEAPIMEASPVKRSAFSILLSAKSAEALQDYHDRVINFIRNQGPEFDTLENVADLAYTLQVGRNHYAYRSGIVCDSLSDALNQLIKQKRQDASVLPHDSDIKIAFLFSGQGTQYVNMSRGLYESEPVYRTVLDNCLNLAAQSMHCDLHEVLFPAETDAASAGTRLFQTQYTHPVLFSVAYALSKLLQHWGIKPDMLLGHSLGEYVAACLAGVFSLEDAIHLVCVRGQAISGCDAGAMLSVPLSPDEVQPFCHGLDASIAVQAAPAVSVLSGSVAAIQVIREKIVAAYPRKASAIKLLNNSHPFHTALLQKAVKPFLNGLQSVKKNAPKIPYLSNLTGNWITESEISRDQYWIDHMLQPVQLSRCLDKLLDNHENTVFVEIGAGRSLLSCLQMHADTMLKTVDVLSDPIKLNQFGNEKKMAFALKDLWCYGCNIDWKSFYAVEKRQRIPLPTYPFQRKRFWVDQVCSHQPRADNPDKAIPDLACYVPGWISDPENSGFINAAAGFRYKAPLDCICQYLRFV